MTLQLWAQSWLLWRSEPIQPSKALSAGSWGRAIPVLGIDIGAAGRHGAFSQNREPANSITSGTASRANTGGSAASLNYTRFKGHRRSKESAPLKSAFFALAATSAFLASISALPAQTPSAAQPVPASLADRRQVLNELFHDYWEDRLKHDP